MGWTGKCSGRASKQLTRKPKSHLRPAPTARQMPRRGSALAQQTLDQRSCLIRDAVLFQALHKLAWARLTLMLLFAIMRTAILLEAGGSTCGAGVSDDHSSR